MVFENGFDSSKGLIKTFFEKVLKKIKTDVFVLNSFIETNPIIYIVNRENINDYLYQQNKENAFAKI